MTGTVPQLSLFLPVGVRNEDSLRSCPRVMSFRVPFPGLSPAFLEFVGPARQSPEVWRLFIGIILAASSFAVTLIGTLHLFLAFAGDPRAFDTLKAFQAPSLADPEWVLWLLFGFCGLSLGVAIAVRIMHGRSPLTLVHAPDRPIARDFCVGVLVAVAVLAPGSLAVFLWSEPTRNMQVSVWMLWMVPALPLVLLQAFSEELLFRGYLQQQLAARVLQSLDVVDSAILRVWSTALRSGNLWLERTLDCAFNHGLRPHRR